MYSQAVYKISKRGFTVLELLVAVSVTALLAGMLLNITSQVIKTQTQASGNLETNQASPIRISIEYKRICNVQFTVTMGTYGWLQILLNSTET